MTRNQFAAMLICVVVFAFLGGLTAELLLRGTRVAAQPEVPEEDPFPLKATAFILVDAEGATRAALTMNGGEPALTMMGSQKGCNLALGTARTGPSLKLMSPGATTVTLGQAGLRGINSNGIGRRAQPLRR